jgi:hypothetical protein
MSLTSPNRGWALEKIEYDSGQLEGIHADLGKLDDTGGDAQIVLRNVDGGLEGIGQSITLVQNESGALAIRMNPTIATFGRIADVVRAYGEAVAVHAKTANDLIDDIEAAHAANEAAVADLDTAESEQQQCTPDDDARTRATAEQGVTDAQSSLATSRSALEGLWESWEAAYSLWDEAYGAAITGSRALGRDAPQRLDPLSDRRARERRQSCCGYRDLGQPHRRPARRAPPDAPRVHRES